MNKMYLDVGRLVTGIPIASVLPSFNFQTGVHDTWYAC
jgi:hypothetical protein